MKIDYEAQIDGLKRVILERFGKVLNLSVSAFADRIIEYPGALVVKSALIRRAVGEV